MGLLQALHGVQTNLPLRVSETEVTIRIMVVFSIFNVLPIPDISLLIFAGNGVEKIWDTHGRVYENKLLVYFIVAVSTSVVGHVVYGLRD